MFVSCDIMLWHAYIQLLLLSLAGHCNVCFLDSLYVNGLSMSNIPNMTGYRHIFGLHCVRTVKHRYRIEFVHEWSALWQYARDAFGYHDSGWQWRLGRD